VPRCSFKSVERLSLQPTTTLANTNQSVDVLTELWNDSWSKCSRSLPVIAWKHDVTANDVTTRLASSYCCYWFDGASRDGRCPSAWVSVCSRRWYYALLYAPLYMSPFSSPSSTTTLFKMLPGKHRQTFSSCSRSIEKSRKASFVLMLRFHEQ